jgi:hypothetical protein
MTQATFISSMIGVSLNVAVTATLLKSQLKQSMENTVLISFFLTNALSCYFTFAGHFSCRLNGFGMQITNLSSQIALFCIAWKYTMKKQISRFWYLLWIWLPTLCAFAILPQKQDIFRNGAWSICIKDFHESNFFWMALEILTIFVSTMTLSLAGLVTYTVSSNMDQLVQKKRHGFLRLFAFLLFDTAICFVSGVHNLIASLSRHGPLGIAFTIGTLQLLHTILSPTLFLLLHNGVRKAMVRLATGNRYGTTLSPSGSRVLGDQESAKGDTPNRSRSNLISPVFESPNTSPSTMKLLSSPRNIQIYDETLRSAFAHTANPNESRQPLTSRSPTKSQEEI